MYLLLQVILSISLSNLVLIHSYPCSCSCCLGSGCVATTFTDPAEAQQCTDTSCLAACKARYYQCNAPTGQGQARGYCTSTTTTTPSSIIDGPYICQCNCCHTGTYQCTLSFVGWTNAYLCTEGACSISCAKKYPNSCVNNQYGRTEGFCTGGAPSSTNAPARKVRCGCNCIGSNGYQTYEVVSSAGCSDCLRACQSIQLQCYSYQNNYCVDY